MSTLRLRTRAVPCARATRSETSPYRCAALPGCESCRREAAARIDSRPTPVRPVRKPARAASPQRSMRKRSSAGRCRPLRSAMHARVSARVSVCRESASRGHIGRRHHPHRESAELAELRIGHDRAHHLFDDRRDVPLMSRRAFAAAARRHVQFDAKSALAYQERGPRIDSAAANVSIGNEGTARPAPSASMTARPSFAATSAATVKPSAPLSGGIT